MQKLKKPEISVGEFLQKAISFYRENDFSFALWRLPNTDSICLASSSTPEIWSDVNLEDARPGFIFSPFHPDQKKIYLPADEYFKIEAGQITQSSGNYIERILSGTTLKAATEVSHKVNFSTPLVVTGHSDEKKFYELVAKSKVAVNLGQFEKIVVSRSREVELPVNFDLGEVFISLCNLYPHAMVSVFSSPLTGTWVGATPELLVSVDKEQFFRTVAVAGTQPYIGGMDLKMVTWSQKDIEEQALVERYIISCFKKIRLREYEEHGPKTTVAGNVLHLRTNFDVDMTATNFPQLGTIMLKLLHPTSAVCGMPLDGSLAFLKTHEGYDRQYYSGYLGPINIEKESHLYVNIRCMQLAGSKGILYAGAGVLPDSDPEKEWLETELKMNTLLRAIRQ